MPAKCSAVRYQKHRSLSLRAVLLFCPLCSLCFKGTSKGRTRARRRSGRGRTHEEKCCPQWLFSASQGHYKSRTKQSTPDAKERRSEQKKFLLGEEKGRKGRRKHSKVRAIGERRKRKEEARQMEKEKEQMRLSSYICSLWFCEVMCSFRFNQTFKVEKMLHKPQRACRFY